MPTNQQTSRIEPAHATSVQRVPTDFSSADRPPDRSLDEGARRDLDPQQTRRTITAYNLRTAVAITTVCVLVALPIGAAFSAGGPASSVGAYCPLPEPGETPVCQAPARERYGEFFAAVEDGRIDPIQTAQIEAALTRSGADGDEGAAYLALSSLAYGYYQLAHQTGQQPGTSHRLQARLVRWNALLTKVYGSTDTPPALRQAVRDAAEDLERRAPTTGVTCSAADIEDCADLTGLVGALTAIDERASVRSPLTRLIERLLGPPEDPLGTDVLGAGDDIHTDTYTDTGSGAEGAP